jgi:hypothetical protein
VFLGLIGISFNNEKNRKLLLDKEITLLLFDFINTSELNVYQRAIILLNNVCNIRSVEEKNKIISSGVFNVFHKKLLEISPPPPKKILSNNYYSVYCIVDSIDSLLSSNPSSVSSFLNTPLIPVFLWTLDSTMDLTITSSDEDIYNIQKGICYCFVDMSFFSYNNVCHLVESKVIDCMINIVKKYISQLKENKIIIKEEAVEYGATVIFSTTNFGSNESPSSEKNKFKEFFEEGNKLNKLVDSFKFLNSLPSISPIQKNVINYISVSVCQLLKREKPPRSCDVILSYIDTLRLSPHPTSEDDFDYPLAAQYAWDNIIKNLSIQYLI